MELEDFVLSECAAQVLVERARCLAPSKKERKEAMLAPAIVSARAIYSDISSLTAKKCSSRGKKSSPTIITLMMSSPMTSLSNPSPTARNNQHSDD